MPNFKAQIAKRVKALRGQGVDSFQNTITSSNILTTATALTNNATGPVYIDNIIVETDGTGLAGGTNFEIQRSGSKGLAVFVSDAVSGLGANAAHDMNSFSVTKQRIVLYAGEKLQFLCTGSACTGGGKITVTVIFRRISEAADLTPAATS